MKKNFFIKICEALNQGAKYNLKTNSIELNLSGIKAILASSSITDPIMIDRIENTCKLVAKDACHIIKNNSASFSNISNDVYSKLESISRDIGSKGYLQSTIYAKSALNKSINNSGLEYDFRQRIEEKITAVFNAMQEQDLENLNLNINSLQCISVALAQYINDMQLPTWFGEIFLQRIANNEAAEKNLKIIKSIESDVSLNDAQRQVIGDKTKEFYDISSIIAQNNALLFKIENDIDSKRSAVQKVQNDLEKFMSTVADGVILKFLQEHNKAILPIIKDLEISINQIPQHLDEIEKIDEYYKDVKIKIDPLEKIFSKVMEFEGVLGIKSLIYRDKILNIEKVLNDFISVLEIERVKIASCNQSAIPEEMLIWERSTWQSFKTSCANFSKWFIGDTHNKIYGYADGVEELRRAIADLPETQIILPSIDLYITG